MTNIPSQRKNLPSPTLISPWAGMMSTCRAPETQRTHNTSCYIYKHTHTHTHTSSLSLSFSVSLSRARKHTYMYSLCLCHTQQASPNREQRGDVGWLGLPDDS